MPVEESLEDQILDAFYECYHPLSIQEVSEQLQCREIQVPLPYLTKIIHTLIEGGYLKKVSAYPKAEKYRSGHFIDRYIHHAICLDEEGACEEENEFPRKNR